MTKKVTIEFEMMECPLCHQEYAFTDWDAGNWWCPHICVGNKSIYTVPKVASGTATLTEKDLRDCFERENGYPLPKEDSP